MSSPYPKADRSPPPYDRSSRWTWRITIGLLLAIVLFPTAGGGYYAFLIQRRNQLIERLEEGPYLVNEMDRDGKPWGLPMISEISLTTPFVEKSELLVEEVVRFRELERLSWCGGSIGDEDVRMLRVLRNLKTLELEATDISDDALDVIGQLPALCELDLSATRVTDRIVEKLAGMPSLREVRLRNSLVSQAAADKLRQSRPKMTVVHTPAAGSQHVEAVREIIKRGGLVSDFLGNRAARALFLEARPNLADWSGFDWSRLKHIPNVQFVRLAGIERPGEILASLADLSSLRILALAECPLDRASMKLIIECGALEALLLDADDLDPAQVELEPLAELKQLRELRLTRLDIDVAAMKAIASLPKLSKVEISNCTLEDRPFQAVPLPQQWESLDILSANLSDDDVEQIVRCQGLKRLWLVSTDATDASIDLVLTLPGLADANIHGPQISTAAESRLQAAIKQRREAKLGLPAGK